LDRELIEEAFTNIIDNALDVMGDHGTLTVRTEKDAEQARVELINTGPGLPPELREKIFEPFYTTKEGGVGLGLTIAQRIVEEHHGSIAVDSRPKQQTTTITVQLPFSNSQSGT
ncbi:MAG: ATP-binding protein, partial [Elusimicrobia bacterium]|nr:ATP-binding protein [Elusimicrobiota bacterium]